MTITKMLHKTHKTNLRQTGKVLFSLFLAIACNHCIAIAQNTIEPLIKSSWHQREPFNYDCPDGTVAGCGSIAVGQIMNYHRTLLHGFGRATYNTGNTLVDVDFDSMSFDWPNIRDTYQSENSDAEKTAVASLVHQVGAAMRILYGTSSPTSDYASMMWGLQHYLHFSPTSRFRRRLYYSTAQWIEMLDKELQNNQPVLYNGYHTQPNEEPAGHFFIIDGKNEDGNYHFNYGQTDPQYNKFTDLNIINQGNGIWPGQYSVSYHHRQAMVTDFYQVDGLTDADYDPTAIVLNTPIVLEKQADAKTVTVKNKVHAQFMFRYANFTTSDIQFSIGFYQQGTLKAVSETIRTTTPRVGGSPVAVGRDFRLPKDLPDGDYDMCIVSRINEQYPWTRGWDNAPNRIPVTVNHDEFTFTLPDYHSSDASLFLTDNGITEVETPETTGKIFELTVWNISDNNFEDSIRFVLSSGGTSYSQSMPTSIYDGQKVTYRFFVPYNQINDLSDYTTMAYHKETSTGNWMLLQEYISNVHQPQMDSFSGIEIYNINGILVNRINKSDIGTTYAKILANLPKGIFIIRDKNGTRKYIKRQ